MVDYIPFEYPASEDGEYTAVLNEGQILLTRRLQLGLTQHQVVEMAGLHLSQYQRLEAGERIFSGCSVKTGLAVCTVLRINPADIVQPCAHPADSRGMVNLPLFEARVHRRVGRKKIRRDIMRLIITNAHVLIPEAVINALGKPSHLRYLHERNKQRILLSAAEGPDSPDVYSVPSEGSLTIPKEGIIGVPLLLSARCRLVKNRAASIFILCDLTTAEK